MFLLSLGVSNPPNRFSQPECWNAFQASQSWTALRPRSKAILRKVLNNAEGVRQRYLALDDLSEAFEIDPDTMHKRFTLWAPKLAALAAQKAMDEAGLDPGRIDGLIVSSHTGYLCPGLTSYVSELLQLRNDTYLLDLVGQGCGAALPSLRAASALLDSGQCGAVLSICVEVCTAAFYLDDDPGVLISACLFGDGAAAAILTQDPAPGRRRIEWLLGETQSSPKERDCLRFQHRGGLLRSALSPRVPEIVATHVEAVLGQVLKRHGATQTDISAWVLHAGGNQVLKALRRRLGLTEKDTAVSAAILKDYGNMSSPFVLFVLKEQLAQDPQGGLWFLASFGAGFSAHGALLNVSNWRQAA
jgi:predicted naringenin-chalcone synthase